MNFFEHQDEAHRRTRLLLAIFAAGIVGTMVAMQLVVSAILMAGHRGKGEGPDQTVVLVSTGLGVLVVVLGGSLWKMAELRRGGRVLAEQLGGQHLHGGNADEDGRRLLNVVEEMALASGVPVPDVYVLPHERGINAFAAGFTPADAVLGVTQGAVKQLSREQLQGVVAHEFSHILNGDMALNLRLVGWVHGLLAVSLLGQVILRGLRHARVSRDGRNAVVAVILLVGLVLWVIGFIGMVFASLVKAAASRQRELLADASAVQFTRHPAGLAGALKIIGARSIASLLRAPAASLASHMFFARGTRADWFDTHPPIPERIRRLDPAWDGRFEAEAAPAPTPTVAPAPVPRPAELPEGVAALALVGQPRPAHLRWADELLAGLPDELRADLAEPFGARSAAYALMLAGGQDVERPGLPLLRARDPAAAERAARLLPRLAALGPAARLPLLDLLLPALRAQSREQFEAFAANLRVLVDADHTETLLEWVLQRLLVLAVRQHLDGVRPPPTRHAGLLRLQPEVGCLLSAVAHAAGPAEAVARSFARAAAELQAAPGLALVVPEACGPDALAAALDTLAEASPSARQRVLAACAAAISADSQVTPAEAELLRAIAVSLHCPMPPVLPGQPLRPAA